MNKKGPTKVTKQKDGSEIACIKDDLIKMAGLLSSRLSISPIAGQIYALLYLSRSPVSLNDMVRELGISKGSASTNIRALEFWGAVKKVWVNSDRKDYYEGNPGIEDIVLKRIKEGVEKRMNEVIPYIEAVGKKLENAGFQKNSKDRQFMEKRFKKINDLVYIVQKVLKLMPDKVSGAKSGVLKSMMKLL